MNIAINKTFSQRDDLDKFVRSRFGEDPAANADVTIAASPDEMAALSIDETTTIYGVKIVPAEASGDVVAQPSRVVLGSRKKAKRKAKK